MHLFIIRNINDNDCDKILKIANSLFKNNTWYIYLLQNRFNLNIHFCQTCNISYLSNKSVSYFWDINNTINSFNYESLLIRELNKLTCAEFIIKNIIE